MSNPTDLAKKADLAGMELRGYLVSLETILQDAKRWEQACLNMEERCSDRQDWGLARLWDEAQALLDESVSELPQTIESLEHSLSGIENVSRSLVQIAQIMADRRDQRHNARLASKSAFSD